MYRLVTDGDFLGRVQARVTSNDVELPERVVGEVDAFIGAGVAGAIPYNFRITETGR